MAEGARPRIVLINDDPAFLELMEELLEKFEGYEVLLRKERERASEFVKQQQPDLVILDVRMGGEEAGWQILESLRLEPETAAIPLIICSAAVHGLRDRDPRLRRRGIEVLPKPFELDELLEKVEQALGQDTR